MQARHLSRIALLSTALIASQAFAQRSPDSVTEPEIGQLQSSIQEGCVARGAERKDPAGEVQESCSCATEVLRVKVSKKEWQAAVAAAFNGDKQTATDILARHQQEVTVCKPVQKTPHP